jgi:hypothetical protein
MVLYRASQWSAREAVLVTEGLECGRLYFSDVNRASDYALTHLDLNRVVFRNDEASMLMSMLLSIKVFLEADEIATCKADIKAFDLGMLCP